MQNSWISSLFFILLQISCLTATEQSKYFDPLQVAKEETAAWKDYYNGDIGGLMQHLSHLVITEFRLNQFSAWTTVVPELLAAATIFKNLPHDTSQEEYNRLVLPHLETAYESIRENLQGKWSAKEAAKEELTWWIYRRHKNTSNPEIVGMKIANLYRLIYGKNDHSHFERAGYLRAIAGRYRDITEKKWHPIEETDWQIIENILVLSYQEMLLGIKYNREL